LSDFVVLTATVRVPVDPFEIQVQLRNASPARLRVEPRNFVFRNRDQTVMIAPLTLAETLALIRSPLHVVTAAVKSGLPGLIDSVDSQRRWAAYAEANALKAFDLTPDRTAKGSLFFKTQPNLSIQGELLLTNLKTEAGETLPNLTAPCPVPVHGHDVAVGAPKDRTYVMTAKSSAGPLTVRVQQAILTTDTVLALAVENTDVREAVLFSGPFDRWIEDEGGRRYFVREIRSTLPGRIGPRSRVDGRLAFDALPADRRRATLILPDVRAGGRLHRVEVGLRF
jgi:hypothetical protein